MFFCKVTHIILRCPTKHTGVCLIFTPGIYKLFLLETKFITNVTCLQWTFTNSVAYNQKSPVCASLCFPLVWFKEIYNNGAGTIKQHKRVCVDNNLQESTHLGQQSVNYLIHLQFSLRFAILECFLKGYQCSNVWNTEGKIVWQNKSSQSQNTTEVLQFQFFIRTKLYLWINKSDTKTLTQL